jgi:tetratricopeptide (TPR) repeat protein
MKMICRIGLTISIAAGASWMALAQDEVPPAAPPAPPSIAPVAPVPHAIPAESEDLAPEPALAPFRLDMPDIAIPPIPPLSPDVAEMFAAVPAMLARADAMKVQAAEVLKSWQLKGPSVLAEAEKLRDQAMLFALQVPPAPPAPPASNRNSDRDDHYYERGKSDLDSGRWEKAANDFGEVVSRGGAHADGALYWKAYALNKLGRRDEALSAVSDLRKNYASSRWLDDARALEIEIKQASGKSVGPESADDEEMKLMALNGLLSSDPDRALPLLEKLLHSSQSPKIKERAMFVLTQSGSSKARQLVVQIAKGGSNPDLQMKAVHYLGVMSAKQELGEVYAATNDIDVKRAVLHGLMVGGAKEQLFAAAKSEKNPDLRRDAIHWLGAMGAESELWQLYQNEPVTEVKEQIVRSLFVGGKTDRLLEVAKTAKEPEIRQQAIHWLGASGSHQAGDALAVMYANESNPEVKGQIIHALFVQNNGKALVEIARKENSVELKKQIVHWLSVMKSKEGMDYLMEILNK